MIKTDVSITNATNLRTDFPQPSTVTLDDPGWAFGNDSLPALVTISEDPSSFSGNLLFEFTSAGGLPVGGSLGIIDLERVGSSVRLTGLQGEEAVDVDWQVAFFQTAGIDSEQPVWDLATNTLSGSIAGSWPSEFNNFAFLITNVQLDSLLMEVISMPGDGIAYAISGSSVAPLQEVPAPTTVPLITAGIALIWFGKRNRINA